MVAEPDGWTSSTYERYPYADGATSALRIAPPPLGADADDAPPAAPAPPAARDVAAQVSAEESYQLTNLWRTTVGARLQLPMRVELDTAWSFYVEPLVRGPNDYTVTGTSHLALRFAQSEAVQFRTGVGVRNWSDKTGTTAGVDLSYGVDVFWGKPIVTSVTLNFGSLGSAFVFEVRGTIGVTIDRTELFAGYDHVAMANLDDSRLGVGLGGPVVGARLWF
jgi:hypothetical protein